MFLLNGKHLPEGTSFYDANGTQYPSGWLNQSTEDQKLAIGITWVADPAPFDPRFYWDHNLPKALEDKLEVKEDGSPLYKQVYDKATESMIDTTEQVVTKGLKSNFISQIKQTAGSLLQTTDWTIIRKAERGIDVPATIADKRAHIISEANRLETAITATTTVEELIAVLNNQNWGE
jgi:hypothetical protein